MIVNVDNDGASSQLGSQPGWVSSFLGYYASGGWVWVRGLMEEVAGEPRKQSHMTTLVLAATFAEPQVFEAVVGGFAVFGSIVAFYSAYAAFLSALAGEDGTSIANASAVGLAIGFPLALIVAILDVFDVLSITPIS